MNAVFSHPLGPLPWSLANVDGTMKKSNKAALAKHLENIVDPAESVTKPHATLIDAMALIQKLRGENRTFEELSDHIFESALHAAHGSDRIDVIFDVYNSQSIKSAERINRGSNEGVAFNKIRPNHKIQNWRRLLACVDTKNKLTQLVC